jgi:peptidoglycan biosynthesis protein MviN/MurJ (putative lipid II flippase)
VRSILGTGKFDSGDATLTAAALALFVVSSIGQCLMLLFVRAFYAEGKTTKPLIINIISAIVTIILGYILIHKFPTVLMLPLAFSLGTFLNLFLHWRGFSKSFPGFSRPVLRTALESIGASIVGGYITYKSLYFLVGVFDTTKSIGVFIEGLCAGIIGVIVVVLILFLLKSRELYDIIKTK